MGLSLRQVMFLWTVVFLWTVGASGGVWVLCHVVDQWAVGFMDEALYGVFEDRR
jgi:hypothetical protein